MIERLAGDYMIDRYFTFNNRSSKDFNLLIQNDFEIESGDADVSYTSIPGRNLDIVNTNNRYTNGTIKYECFIDIRWFKNSDYETLSSLRRDLIAWLQVEENFSGYMQLVDNLDGNYYYLARLAKSPTLSFTSPKTANLTIEFNIGPIKYLLGSNRFIPFVSGQYIVNPEPLESYPIFKINGSGAIKLTINGIIYTLTDIGGTSYINSEKHRVYDDSKLKNNIAVFPDYQYPALKYGKNNISWDNSSATIQIQYNWRTYI